MEEDKLKSLFKEFNPELSSQDAFMKRLESNLNAVELIKRHTATVRARNKKALVVGALAGFVTGFLFSLLLPYLHSFIANWQLTLPDESVMKSLAENITVIAWITIAATSAFAAYNTYDLLSSRDSGPAPQK